MSTIKDMALNYVAPPKIADLKEIAVDVEMFDDGEGVNPETDKSYSYSYIIVNDKQVRVPDSVITQLQEQLKANPTMRAFKVNKKGEGIMTKYTVIPIL